MSQFQILAPYVPFLDSRGHITREWYTLLVNLFQATTEGDTEDAALFLDRGPNSSASDSAIRELAAVISTQRSERAAIEMLTRRVVELESILYGGKPWH